MKIGEFAKLSQVSPKLLRHYDALGLLKPAHVDSDNGYRLYTPDQVHHLKWILLLKSLDFSLSEVQVLLSGPVDSAKLLLALGEKKLEVANALNDQLKKTLRLNQLMDMIKTEGFTMESTIDLLNLKMDSVKAIKLKMPTTDMLLDQASAIIKKAINGQTFGLLRIDSKQFKAINDTDGYDVGDKVIVAVYTTFEEVLNKSNLTHSIARAGGDEYVILVEGQPQIIKNLVQDLHQAVKAIDYKALGCHKQLDVYIAGTLSKSFKDKDLRAVMDDTGWLLQDVAKMHKQGGDDIHLIEVD